MLAAVAGRVVVVTLPSRSDSFTMSGTFREVTMQRSQVLVSFLLGACVALFAALLVTLGGRLPEARAQGLANQDMLITVGNGGQQQNRDTLFVIDSKSMRLAIYQLNNGKLTLMAVRNIIYDLKFEEFSTPGQKQAPGVKEVADAVKDKK